jgi:hypothetical protein
MFRRGRSSWRFSSDLNARLHAALFVRDALDLPVATGAAIPPRLDGDIPRLANRISADVRPEAAAEWPAWWDRLVRVEIGREKAAGDHAMIRQHLGELIEHVDPPAWRSLQDRPGLRAAAQATFEEGHRWADQTLGPLKYPDPCRQFFQWDWIRDVAKQVARDQDVNLGAVRGSAQVLLVGGRWWTLIESGSVLCSAAAAEDEATARRVLRLTFESTISG